MDLGEVMGVSGGDPGEGGLGSGRDLGGGTGVRRGRGVTCPEERHVGSGRDLGTGMTSRRAPDSRGVTRGDQEVILAREGWGP